MHSLIPNKLLSKVLKQYPAVAAFIEEEQTIALWVSFTERIIKKDPERAELKLIGAVHGALLRYRRKQAERVKHALGRKRSNEASQS